MTKQSVGLRRSDVAEQVPSENDIGLGELAFNTAEGKIYFKKLDGTVVELTDKFTKDEIEMMLIERDVTLSFDFLNENYEVVKIATLTTDDIAENDNLYFTQERARQSVSAGGDLHYNSSTGEFSVTTYKSSDFDNDFSGKSTTNLSEGNNLYFTESRSRNSISAEGDLEYNSSTGVMSYTTPSSKEIKQGLESIQDTNFLTDIEKSRVQNDPLLMHFL